MQWKDRGLARGRPMADRHASAGPFDTDRRGPASRRSRARYPTRRQYRVTYRIAFNRVGGACAYRQQVAESTTSGRCGGRRRRSGVMMAGASRRVPVCRKRDWKSWRSFGIARTMLRPVVLAFWRRADVREGRERKDCVGWAVRSVLSRAVRTRVPPGRPSYDGQ